MKSLSVYKAFDGTDFNTLEECKTYEYAIINKKIKVFSRIGRAMLINDKSAIKKASFVFLKDQSSVELTKLFFDNTTIINFSSPGLYVWDSSVCGWIKIDKQIRYYKQEIARLKRIKDNIIE